MRRQLGRAAAAGVSGKRGSLCPSVGLSQRRARLSRGNAAPSRRRPGRGAPAPKGRRRFNCWLITASHQGQKEHSEAV